MNQNNFAIELSQFHQNIAQADQASGCWESLQTLTNAVVGSKLFTIMQTDMVNGIANRSFTSDPKSYPVSGSKPIVRNRWFNTIFEDKRTFVANTIAEIVEVFPDHELIWSLGCGSVVNLPVFIGAAPVGTLNVLHEEHYYSAERVARIETVLAEPTRKAFDAAHRF